jgi:hypothetical protein
MAQTIIRNKILLFGLAMLFLILYTPKQCCMYSQLQVGQSAPELEFQTSPDQPSITHWDKQPA